VNASASSLAPLVATSVPGAAPAARADLSRLRIAFISGNYNCVRDGANRAQNMLVRYLTDRGAAVRVYSPTCDEPAFEPAGELVSVPSLPMMFGRKEYRFSPRLPRATQADIAAFGPNLFHISLPFFHGKSALALARRMQVPAVAAMHTRFETYPAYYHLGLLTPAVVARLRHFYTRCERIVAPCESAARTMEAQGMGRNVGIWSRGVDREVFAPARRDLAFRRSLGIGDDEIVVGFLGRLVLEKGLGDFADTIARLRAQGLAFRVLVIGDGPARGWFAERLGDAAFAGFLHGEELGRALASADVLLNPSATEAFGNVSLEAMACGVPVVAADAPGNSNLVIDGKTGALVVAGDIAGYAGALRHVLIDPALRASYAKAAREHSAKFSWDRANAAMVETYFAALGDRQLR